MTYAKIIADSISPEGVRLTTSEVRFHRFVLAEFNTHRVFSRNSASSRAIPFEKQVTKIRESLAYPVQWATEQKGMQGGPPLTDQEDIEQASDNWLYAAEDAIEHARALRVIGDPDSDDGTAMIHKSLVNRLLEPFMWHTVVVTSTSFENFFEQRCHSAAQPEIRVAAEAMKAAYDASEPKRLAEGEWHLPYIEPEDWETLRRRSIEDVRNLGKSMYPEMTKISAARCARVSYLTQDGKRDLQADLDLYARLTDRQQDAIHAHDPIHWSPLEHVATPWPENRQDNPLLFLSDPDPYDRQKPIPVLTSHLPRVGNLLGWRSLRTEVEATQGVQTYR